jgi:hypothetical protein
MMLLTDSLKDSRIQIMLHQVPVRCDSDRGRVIRARNRLQRRRRWCELHGHADVAPKDDVVCVQLSDLASRRCRAIPNIMLPSV